MSDEAAVAEAADQGLGAEGTEHPASETSAEGTHSVEQQGAHEEVSTEADSFTVVIDGQEQQLSRDEVVKGYQRQADYTRKTQELATEREQLKAADAIRQKLLSDPQATVRELQEWAEQQTAPEAEEDLDPEDAWKHEVDSFIQGQRDRELQSEIDGVVSGLKSEYGDFDQQELLAFAVERKIPDLQAALLLKRELDAKSATTQSDAEVIEAKRQAAVHSGSTAQGSTTKGPQKVESMEDAFAAAKAELNISGL